MTPMASGAEGGSSTAAPVIGRCPIGGDLIENKTFVVGPDGPLAASEASPTILKSLS